MTKTASPDKPFWVKILLFFAWPFYTPVKNYLEKPFILQRNRKYKEACELYQKMILSKIWSQEFKAICYFNVGLIKRSFQPEKANYCFKKAQEFGLQADPENYDAGNPHRHFVE